MGMTCPKHAGGSTAICCSGPFVIFRSGVSLAILCKAISSCILWRGCLNDDEAGIEVSGRAAQMSYARGLITLEQRNRVLNIMKRFRLPLWHVVCHPSLFWKVRLAPALDCCPLALV